LKQVNAWTPEVIQSYCKNLCSETVAELREKGFRIEDEEWRGHHMFGIRLPKSVSMDQLKNKLSENHVHVSVRGSSVRVSPHLYNEDSDVDMLKNALLSLL
jgi:selenocysteine lyase/cysteine desulfurase